jgi:uncharacterized membrane protein
VAANYQSRLAYIDWMRGLACVLMFQTHCYDAWLSPEARKGAFFAYSRLLGGLPAPLFLFLAGISFAMVTLKLTHRGVSVSDVGQSTIRRGAEIFGLGMLFRLQEFLVALGWAPWSDLLRVDILNSIGTAMMLMGLACWAVAVAGGGLRALACMGFAVTVAIAMLTPLLWTVWRPHWLPWPIESYLDGVHNQGVPQRGLFPIFPWAGFAFAGLALGFVLFSAWAKRREAAVVVGAGLAGLAIGGVAYWIDLRVAQIYPVYDFWHTSPNFFFIRLGVLLVILVTIYAWCRWGLGAWGFSPMAQLGQTSLLVYWVHIELVYGKVSILPKRVQNIQTATFGLVAISLAMLMLSIARTRYKGRGAGVWAWLRRPARA